MYYNYKFKTRFAQRFIGFFHSNTKRTIYIYILLNILNLMSKRKGKTLLCFLMVSFFHKEKKKKVENLCPQL